MFVDPSQRTVAIGVWITSYSAGGAIGPLLGGVLLGHFWWGSVFLIGVPVMLLLLIVGPVLLPEFRDPNASRMDLLSAALSLATVLLVIYGIKQIAQGDIGWGPVLSIVSGLVVGVVFVHRQRTLADPLIDLRLFRVRAFSAALAAYALGTFVAFGIFLFVAQYLQLVRGLSPLQAGVYMLPFFISFIAGSMLAPMIARHIRPATLMGVGLGVAAIGFWVLTRVGVTSGLVALVIGCVVYSLGLAPVFTLTTDLIVGAAPPERAGAASALSETGSELGGALGIAVLGSIGTAVYRGAMAHAVPSGVPPEASEAARGTLGGALAVAGSLPGPAGAELLDAARAAFVAAFDVTAGVTAVITVAAALSALALRAVRVRPAGQGTSRAPEHHP
jgi:DHA2 family multidrug resistance protein-like MFS transporter